MEPEVWQVTNEAAIRQRLRWLDDLPPGMIFFEPSGLHFIFVEKVNNELRLVLLEQVNFTSNLVQSCLDLNAPLYLVSPYNQAAMLGLAWCREPQRIYMAGFGGGRIPLVLHHYFPKATIECTEIDPTLIEVATKYFGVELDERLKVACQDGRDYLAQCSQDIKYDLIFIDVFLGNGYFPYSLTTKEFYELCQSHLSPEGVVVVNLINKGSFYTEKVKTIQSVFKYIYLCPLDVGNRIIIGTNGTFIDEAELISRVQSLQQRHQFPFPFRDRALEVKMGSQLSEYMPDLEQAEILTDTSPPDQYFDDLPSFNTLFAKVGSDNPCPCGSGKEFQHCHGQRALG
jgi:spermidine synthase